MSLLSTPSGYVTLDITTAMLAQARSKLLSFTAASFNCVALSEALELNVRSAEAALAGGSSA